MPLIDLNSTDRYAIGLKYTMDMELTPLVPKDANNKAVAMEKTFNDYIKVSYRDSGNLKVVLEDKRFSRDIEYPIRSGFGNILGTTLNDSDPEVTTETGTRTLTVRGRTSDISIHIIDEGNLPSSVTNITQHGTIVQS